LEPTANTGNRKARCGTFFVPPEVQEQAVPETENCLKSQSGSFHSFDG
jgi:hypothetical protein